MLQQIGNRLQTVMLAADLEARLGGDEFAVLLPNTDADQAAHAAEVVSHVLQKPFVLGGQPIAVDVSIGIALAPLHGQDAYTLLRCADVAMYQAKRSGTGVALYSSTADQHSADRLALLGELRSAIDHNELLLYYQPKLDLRTGAVVGVEALVRWQHPQRGFLPPSEFIPLAEQTGLIHPLSRWVLEAALKQHRVWHKLGIDVPVAVNLSRRNLHDPQLPAMVANLLTRWDVPARALILEITESSLMADPLRAADSLEQLRALGVRMSIDDFGTGYSSLASLKNLSVDELKIDLADALKLRVVAEGVEDRPTWDVLAGLGCAVAQGYFLSRPMPASDLEAWVSQAGPSWLAIAESAQAHDALRERIRGRGARLIAEEEFVARKRAEAALRTQLEKAPTHQRVLAVDDEPRLARALVRMLKPSGYVVSVAGSGEEALEKLAAQAFDVVVSDMGMGPGMNGWELAEAVRRRWPGMRFLLAGGAGATTIDPQEAHRRGVEAFLSKPYDRLDLLQALTPIDTAA